MRNTIVLSIILITTAILCVGCNKRVVDSDDLSPFPSYWAEHLNQKLQVINEIDSDQFTDSFIFLTDYHIENNAGHSHQLIEYLCEKSEISNLVFGGDIFNGDQEKETVMHYLDEFYNRFLCTRMYGIRGNHEYNLTDGGSPEVMISDAELFKVLIERVSNDVHIGNDSLYYYRDINSLCLRYIYLDSRYGGANSIDLTQLQWLSERVNELSEEWSVIVFTHQLFSIVSPGKKVIQHPGYCISGQRIIELLTSIHPKAKIIAIISGHGHYDYSSNINGFWEISTTCDSSQEYGGLPTTLGTINEQAFDVFSINLKAHTIKAIRIGRG